MDMRFTLLTGVLAVTMACGAEPDYERVANTALDNAKLSDVDADYDGSAKVVHLTGTVASESDRQHAGDVVQRALPEGAQIANEVTVAGGHAETADDLDDGLETRLENLVELDAVLKTRDVSFEAVNGVVTITGRVATENEKARVEQIARAEPGVRDVVNSIAVGAE